MELGIFIKIYIIAFIIFLIVDAIWLGLVATKFYKNTIGHLMADKPNYIAAGIFYLIYIGGIVFFTYQGIVEGNIGKVLLNAAIFGFIAYATYDLTNLATLKDWPIKVTIVDLIWGTSLSTIISMLSYYIYHWIF